jgi:hypothetical protein
MERHAGAARLNPTDVADGSVRLGRGWMIRIMAGLVVLNSARLHWPSRVQSC